MIRGEYGAHAAVAGGVVARPEPVAQQGGDAVERKRGLHPARLSDPGGCLHQNL